MKALLLALLLAAGVPGQDETGNAPQSAQNSEAATKAALQQGDFATAINLALPKAQAGNPEHQFGVGYLMLLWLDAPSPKEPPRHSLDDAVVWIRKAAAQDLPQAAGFLRSGYEWGRHGLPKHPALEACWRKVENGEQAAVICISQEEEAQPAR
jgi:hypothetical protein